MVPPQCLHPNPPVTFPADPQPLHWTASNARHVHLILHTHGRHTQGTPFTSSRRFLSTKPNAPQIHERARQAYRSGKTKSITFRKEQIAQVGYLVKDNEQRITDALKADLGRPILESVLYVIHAESPLHRRWARLPHICLQL